MLRFTLLLSINIFLLSNLKSQVHTIEHDGIERSFILHTPENIKSGAPLIIAMHGYTGSANNISNYSGLNAVSEEHGFVVCYPQGTKDGFGNRFFNVGYDFHWNETVDDVGFIIKLTAYLQDSLDLSKTDVFATGLSNGGDMSYLLACEADDKIKAIAPVAGMILQDILDDCNPNNPMPIFEIHGTEDDVTYYEGDPNNLDGWGAYPSVDQMMEFWVDINQCEKPLIESLSDIDNNDGSFVISEKYLNGINGNEVWLYKVQGGGHDWPGSWGNMDINSAEEIWKFFSRFLETETSNENVSFSNSEFTITPNPSRDFCTVEVNKDLIGNKYSIINQIGQVLYTSKIVEKNFTIDLKDFQSGIYFLHIQNINHTQKITVID